MKYLILMCVLLLIGAIGCRIQAQAASKNMEIEVSVENGSMHDLDWVRVVWEGPDFSAGILRADMFSTDVNLKWPFVPKGKLTFVDGKTRQRYNIDLAFKVINEEIKSGRCHAVTIRILDYDKAEIVSGYPRKSGRK